MDHTPASTVPFTSIKPYPTSVNSPLDPDFYLGLHQSVLAHRYQSHKYYTRSINYTRRNDQKMIKENKSLSRHVKRSENNIPWSVPFYKWVLFWPETHPPSKFRGNPLNSLCNPVCVILLTNQHTDTRKNITCLGEVIQARAWFVLLLEKWLKWQEFVYQDSYLMELYLQLQFKKRTFLGESSLLSQKCPITLPL